MVVIETSIFTRQVRSLLTEDEYGQLQIALVQRPELGAVIVGSGGLRKARWSAHGQGKRGGVRVIYYWVVAHDRLLMLTIYGKNEQDDLSPDQVKLLRKIVEEQYP